MSMPILLVLFLWVDLLRECCEEHELVVWRSIALAPTELALSLRGWCVKELSLLPLARSLSRSGLALAARLSECPKEELGVAR